MDGMAQPTSCPCVSLADISLNCDEGRRMVNITAWKMIFNAFESCTNLKAEWWHFCDKLPLFVLFIMDVPACALQRIGLKQPVAPQVRKEDASAAILLNFYLQQKRSRWKNRVHLQLHETRNLHTTFLWTASRNMHFWRFFCLEVFEAPKRLSLPDQAKAVIAKFCSGMATLPHVSNPFFVRKFEGLAKVTARPAPSKNAGCSCQRHW